MFIVTGGAGLIGSAVIWQLNKSGITDILVIDHLGTSDKWKNLSPLKFDDYLEKDIFRSKLASGTFNGSKIDGVIHMGACSSTTISVTLRSWLNSAWITTSGWSMPQVVPPTATAPRGMMMMKIPSANSVRSTCTDTANSFLICTL